MTGSSKRVKGKEGVSEEAVYKKHTPSVPGKQQALGQNASLPGCGLRAPVSVGRCGDCPQGSRNQASFPGGNSTFEMGETEAHPRIPVWGHSYGSGMRVGTGVVCFQSLVSSAMPWRPPSLPVMCVRVCVCVHTCVWP